MLKEGESSQTRQSQKFLITASGFENKTKKVYEKYINKLGGTYSDLLKMDTNILITTNVLSEKYRGACLLNIPIVSSNWLEESFSAGEFLDAEAFKIKIFKGVNIGILGFDPSEVNEIKIIIKENEGESVTSIATIQSDTNIDIVIGKGSEIKKYDSFLLNMRTPTVSIEWLKSCLISRQYLKPDKYRLNAPKTTRQSAGQRAQESLNLLTQIEGHLNKVLQEADLNDCKWSFLEKAVIYLHKPINSKIERLLKKLIDAGGGLYTEENNPYVTHIVAEEYLETDIKLLSKFREGRVLNIFWLKDCLIYQRLVKEDDYILIPVSPSESLYNALKGNVDISSLTLQRRNTMNITSQGSYDESIGARSWGSQTINPTLSRSNSARTTGILPSYDASKIIPEEVYPNTISNIPKPASSKQEQKERVKIRTPKKEVAPSIIGFVFKNVNFMFHPKLDKASTQSYKKKILEHSGKILDNLNIFEEIYYLLPDNEESFKILQNKDKKKNIRFVSPRWIDYCIGNKLLTRDLEQKKLIHLFPLPFKVPLHEFKNKTMYCAGFSPYDKKMMQELIELMGAKFSFENLSELTCLICEDKTTKKYEEVKTNCPNAKILSSKWIFECIKQGKIMETNSYLI